MTERAKAFERLATILDELRAQCPWDMKQTMESLRHLTIEETFELADSIQKLSFSYKYYNFSNGTGISPGFVCFRLFWRSSREV